MITSRWWAVALAVTGAAMIAILVVTGTPAADLTTGVAIVACYLLVFGLLRRRAVEGSGWGLAFMAATVIFAGSLTALSPELAVSQFIAFPLTWVLAGSVRRALLGSLVLALAVGLGFWVSFGERVGYLPQILGTQVLSLGFSVVMGLWITHIASLGEEKARLLDELTAAQDELAVLHRDAGVTSERARLSREMHDTVAQSLTGVVLLAQRARRQLASGTLDDETLELIETGTRDALAETRALVAASAPVEIDQGGIADALRRLGERFERETRVRVVVTAALDAALDRDSEVVLLRCAQEGLANVRKHSDAASATVELSTASGTARLVVTDDGRGFPAEVRPGFGIAGLRDRVTLAGGTLEADGTPGATRLIATLPVGGAA